MGVVAGVYPAVRAARLPPRRSPVVVTGSYCAEIGPGGYDEYQALEGAAGSVGRTESTSVST